MYGTRAKAKEDRMKSGIGFPSLLTIVFIVLKLTNVISWGWFWVLFPAILSAAIIIGIAVVGAIIETR
jgi:hypothetical protein